MMMRRSALASAAMCLIWAGSTCAAPFTNGSFETGTNPGSYTTVVGSNSAAIASWTVPSGGSVDYIGSYWQAADGSRSIDLNGSNVGSIQQTFDTIAGQAYQAAFSMSGNPDGGLGTKTMLVGATGNVSQAFSFTVGPSQTHANMNWTSMLYSFVATGASTTLSFASTTASQPFFGPALDNVSVTAAAVPEPASLALWGGMSALGAAFGWRRRRAA
jgi:choice-of-anchor C domain-containing protein